MTQSPAPTSRRRLYDRALDQHGFVTSTDARALGVERAEMHRLARNGWLERRGHGLYRFLDIPYGDHDAYMEAVLWAGPGAVLSHDAVLALHELAEANPRTLRVTVSRRVRRAPRASITLLRGDVPDSDRATYHGIPCTTVARALIDSRDLVMHTRLVEAMEQAHERGLLHGEEHTRVAVALAECRP